MKIVHTALFTNKFDESIKFYKDVFSAESMGEFTTSTRGCWLKIGESILEIFKCAEPLPEIGTFKHIAIECDDVDALFNHAIKCGATPIVQPKTVTLNLTEPKTLKVAFVTGVNGEQIEICCEV